MSDNFIVVKEDDRVIFHEFGGQVFRKVTKWNDEYQRYSVYYFAITDSFLLEALQKAAKTGFWEDLAEVYYVRRHNSFFKRLCNPYVYYPLQLLFLDQEERDAAAMDVGKKSPTLHWVERKRKEVFPYLEVNK